jgi:LytS/YehU family sensor histidine kinase
LDFLQAFLQIHQTLMGKRLLVEWKIEPETLSALVPHLILQPLVENSIQHGIAPLEGAVESKFALNAGTNDSSCRFGTADSAWHRRRYKLMEVSDWRTPRRV